jgi:hypothetical protein
VTRTPILSAEQRDRFLADGAVCAPGAIPLDDVEAMASRIWAALGVEAMKVVHPRSG